MYPYKRTISKCSHIHPNQSSPCDICQQNLRCRGTDDVLNSSIRLSSNAVDAIGSPDNKTMAFPSLITPLDQTSRPVNICPQPRNSEQHLNAPQYKCKYCPKIFNDNSNLLRHTRIHTGEKPFKCNICNKSFTQSGSLKTHRKLHTRIKEFICKECNKCFSRKGDLKAHQSVRLKLKRFECDICKKKFTWNRSMKRHIKTVHKLNELSCTLNERTISQKENFRTSIQHHKRNMLPKKNYNQKISTTGFQVNISSTPHSLYSNQDFSNIVNQNAHLDRSITGLNHYKTGYIPDEYRMSGTSQIRTETSSVDVNSQNQAYYFPSKSSYVAELPIPCQTGEWDQRLGYVCNPPNSNYLNDATVSSQSLLSSNSENVIEITNTFSDSDNGYQASVLESSGRHFYSVPPPVLNSNSFTSLGIPLHKSFGPNQSVSSSNSSNSNNLNDTVVKVTNPFSD